MPDAKTVRRAINDLLRERDMADCDWGWLSDEGSPLAPILDATVYGICGTCGGSRKCPECAGKGGERSRHTVCAERPKQRDWVECWKCNGSGACPDCTAVSVLTKELRDYVISDMVPGLTSVLLDVLNDVRVDCLGYAKEVAPHITDAVLSTVLGKTRVAEEIAEASADVEYGVQATSSLFMRFKEDEAFDIAILEDDDE